MRLRRRMWKEEPGSEESEEADVEEPGAGNEPEEADAGQKSERERSAGR